LNGNQWTDGTERENSLGRNTQGEDLGQDRIEFQGSGGAGGWMAGAVQLARKRKRRRESRFMPKNFITNIVGRWNPLSGSRQGVKKPYLWAQDGEWLILVRGGCGG
jgi:hypothetical protein